MNWEWARNELRMNQEWAENELRLRLSKDRAQTELRLMITIKKMFWKSFGNLEIRGRDLFSTTFISAVVAIDHNGAQASNRQDFIHFGLASVWSLSWNCTGCVICCNFLPPQIGLFFCGIAMGAANVNVFVNLLATFVTQKHYGRKLQNFVQKFT